MKQTYLFLAVLVALTFNSLAQTLTITDQSITCATLGSATVTVNGGTGPFSYSWSPTSQTTSIATGLNPGSYTIVVFDAGTSSSISNTIVFNSPVPFTGNISTPLNLRCNGVATGSAGYTNIAGGSGNENYYWTNGTATSTSAILGNVSAGNWTSTVTDALTSCTISNTFTITQPPALSLTAVANSPTVCPGNSILLTANGSGGTPSLGYKWTNGPMANTYLITETVSGTYVYTIELKDGNGCSITNTISVIFNPLPIPLITASNTNICAGGTLTINAIGTSTLPITGYQWSGPNGFSSVSQNTLINNVSLNNTGVYSVTLTAANTCTASASATITILQLPILTATAYPACETQTINLIAYSPTGSTYLWSGPGSYTSNAQYPVISPAGLNHIGTYTVVVFSALNSCSASTTASVIVNPKPIIAINGSTVCAGETMTLSANSGLGTYFSWTGPAAFSSPNPTILITSATLTQSGTYTVQANGSNGCLNTATVSALVKAVPIPTINSNSPVCSGNTLQLTGLGGVAYMWTGPLGFNSAIQNPTISSVGINNAGVYNVSVTAANSCTASASYTVAVNLTPTLSAMGSTVCTSKTMSLSASAAMGTTFLWSGPMNYTSTLQNNYIAAPNINQSGIYQVLATSLSGCTNAAVTQVNVVLPPPLSVGLSSSSICAQGLAGSPNTIVLISGGASTFTVGTPNYIYNNNPAGPISVLSAIAPFQNTGLTTATVIGSNGVCTVSTTAVFTIFPNPTNLNIVSSTPTLCSGQSTTLTASGANTFTWNNSSVNSLNVVSPNVITSYTVLGTDTNDCSNIATITVNVFPTTPTLSLVSSPFIICTGQSATLIASGASTYSWNAAAANSVVIVSPTSSSSFSVLGFDTNGCSKSASVTVTVNNCTSSNELTAESSFLIYPNPAQDEINIKTNGFIYESARIINSIGQIIKTIKLDNQTLTTIDLENLQNGFYFLEIKGDSGILTKRFAVSR